MSTENTNPSQNSNDPYADLSEHDRKMLEVAQANGVKVELSNAQTGERNVFTMADVAPTNTQEEPAAAVDGNIPARPAHVPEKFWDAKTGKADFDAMARSYGELEQKLSGKPTIAKPGVAAPAVAPAAKPADAPQVDVQASVQTLEAALAKLAAATTDEAKAAAGAEVAAAKAAIAQAVNTQTPVSPQTDLNAAIAVAAGEYASNGSFSEESLAKMESMGITREYSAAYLDGLKARAEVIEFKTWEVAGGKQQFGVMSSWAQANMSAEQIQTFNADVTSGDVTKTLAAVQNLKALYDATQGAPASRREEPAPGSATTGVDMFKSADEMTAAMRDPKYGRDTAYTAEVERKLAASVKANVNLGVTAMF